MELFVQQVINGLLIGSAYALVAVGFTTIYGVVNILNVAQADLGTLAAYAALFAFSYLHWGVLGAVGAFVCASILIAGVLYFGLFTKLPKEDLLGMFVATIGVSFIIEYGLARIAGSAPLLFPSLLPSGGISAVGLTVPYAGLVVFGVSVGLCISVAVVVGKTRLGRQLRAVAASADTAMALGVNVGRVRFTAVLVGCLLAGVAGFMLATLYGSVNPFFGQTLAFDMFIIAIVGGLGSTMGTLAISLLVGVIPSVASPYVSANLTAILPLALLVVVLRIRPEGLFGGIAVRRG